MHAPRLAPFASVSDDHTHLPAIWRSEQCAVFVVMTAGEFAGIRYGVGDILLCCGEAVQDEPVVLVARGQGRPRLGWVRGDLLLGDLEEPCSAARWQVGGRVSAVMRATARSVALVRGPSVPRQPRVRAVPGREALGQLSLFASAA
jgi:hypothetical protein